METLSIEVHHLADRTRSHLTVSTFPATVGREHDNQVVLTDPEVSLLHARLERADDGTVTLVDQGSTNGLLVGEDDVRVPQVVLTHGLSVRLGNCQLTFRDKARRAEKTVVSRRVTRADALGRRRVAAAAVATLLLAMALAEYLNGSGDYDALELVAPAVVFIAAGLGWAAAWSVLGRLVTHTWRFTAHFVLCLLGGAAVVLMVSTVPQVTTFALGLPTATPVVLGLGAGVVAVAVLQAQLRRAVSWSTKRRWLTAAGLAVVVALAATGLSQASHEGFSTSLPITSEALPPKYLLTKRHPLSALLQQVEVLQPEVDALAKEE